jgi:hypothetical protein
MAIDLFDNFFKKIKLNKIIFRKYIFSLVKENFFLFYEILILYFFSIL